MLGGVGMKRKYTLSFDICEGIPSRIVKHEDIPGEFEDTDGYDEITTKLLESRGYPGDAIYSNQKLHLPPGLFPPDDNE
jgi:hypothetical protein